MADPLPNDGPHRASAAGSLGWYPWYVATLLALAQVIAGLDRYLMSVVLEPVKVHLGLSDSELGLLTGTSFAIVFCVASIPLGRLADVTSRRLIIAFGIGGWSLATIACGFADSFWELFIARLGIGLGEAALLPAAVSLLSAYFPPHRLTQGLSVFTAGNSLGRAAAFLGGGALLLVLAANGGLTLPGVAWFRPWQSLMLIAGTIGVAVALACLTIGEPARSNEGAEQSRFNDAARYFWQHRGIYLRIFVLYGLVVGNAMALSTWTISLYVRNYGVSVGNASLIVGFVSLLVGPVANFFGGWLTDRMAAKGTVAPALLITGGILGLTPILGLGFWLLPTLGFAIASYTGVYFISVAASPSCLSALQVVSPDRFRGVISSFYLCLYSLIGFGVAPLLVGLLNDYLFQSEGSINLSLALSFALFAVIGLPLALSGRQGYGNMARSAAALNRNEAWHA